PRRTARRRSDLGAIEGPLPPVERSAAAFDGRGVALLDCARLATRSRRSRNSRRKDMPAEGADIQKELNPLENARAQFEEAAKMLEIDPGLLEIIKQPRRSTIVSLPIQMDDGSLRVFTGYRVQHSIVRGPAKGGI